MSSCYDGGCAGIDELRACLLAFRSDRILLRERGKRHLGSEHIVGDPVVAVRPVLATTSLEGTDESVGVRGKQEVDEKMETSDEQIRSAKQEAANRNDELVEEEMTPVVEEETTPVDNAAEKVFLFTHEQEVNRDAIEVMEIDDEATVATDCDTDPEMPELEPASPCQGTQPAAWESLPSPRGSIASTRSDVSIVQDPSEDGNGPAQQKVTDLGACWGRGALKNALRGFEACRRDEDTEPLEADGLLESP